jgi:hypothetical protein
MTIVQRFNTTAAMLAALTAGFVLAAAPARAGNHGHQAMAAVSSHTANSPPIIAKPGHDGHDKHHGHHHGLSFGFAQTYWPIESHCELRRVHIDRYTDAVIIRRGKPCKVTNDQVVTFPAY